MKAELVPHFLRRRYRAVHEPVAQLTERQIENLHREQARTGRVVVSQKRAPRAVTPDAQPNER